MVLFLSSTGEYFQWDLGYDNWRQNSFFRAYMASIVMDTLPQNVAQTLLLKSLSDTVPGQKVSKSDVESSSPIHLGL